MSAEVVYDRSRGQYVVVDTMDADEARNTAYAWGPMDGAFDELLKAADECDRRNGVSLEEQP